MPLALPKMPLEFAFLRDATWRSQSIESIKHDIGDISPGAWQKCEGFEDALAQSDILWASHAFKQHLLDEAEQLTIHVAVEPHPEWNFVLRKIPSTALVLSCALEIIDGPEVVEMQLTYSMSCTGQVIQCWWADIKTSLTMHANPFRVGISHGLGPGLLEVTQPTNDCIDRPLQPPSTATHRAVGRMRLAAFEGRKSQQSRS